MRTSQFQHHFERIQAVMTDIVSTANVSLASLVHGDALREQADSVRLPDYATDYGNDMAGQA